MKPDEDMHAAVEEVDLDPCDLYTDLGMLIVEGRVPGLTDKGFGEGPHCPTQHAQNRHQCNTSSPECQKYEQILKHMLLLWKNGIPMTIEVLLYPDCCIPSQNVESVPDMAYILLEQWTIHMLPRRVPDASINPRGLIQAVRSFLYFSQLCAWFSLTGGKSPRNIHYRVCVPGEAFSSKFSSPPDLHVFPVANIGRNTAMKVLAKSHPRCGEIPSVLCYKHSQEKTKCRKKEQQLEGELSCLSPADSMLGDSLLDPPNSLCMYPKRYQSPSRCGSPSIEVPEHLMFGKSSSKQEESRRNKKQEETRSRPQRRPVVERFLKKDLDDLDKSNDVACRRTLDQKIPTSKKSDILGLKKCSMFGCCCLEDCIKDVPTEEIQEILEKFHERNTGLKCCHTNIKNSLHNKSLSHLIGKLKMNSLDDLDKSDVACRTLDQKIPTSKKADILPVKKDDMFNYCCLEDCIKDEKMEEILKKLRDRNTGLKYCHANVNYLSEKKNSLPNKSLSHLINELKINSNLLEQNKELKKNTFYNEPCNSKNLFKQALRLHKESSYRKFDRNVISPSVAEVHKCGHSKEQLASLENKLNRFQSSNYFQSENDIKLTCVPEQKNTLQTKSPRYVASKTYQFDPDRTYPKLGSVNIKKCGAFLVKSDQNGEFLSDEREISASVPAKSVEAFDEDIPQISFIIPSAEKKALFRRSLDSATSLVFHQRSGLPLTSSPAPVRKSGTCFDFDSSLTSVSAIKRALFEKEPEEEIVAKENALNLSNSAPSSTVSSSLLGTFEESVLNGRLEPVSTVEGFTAEIGASGSFCPRHITLPVTVFFYTLQDMDKVTSPYMGHINLRNRDYHIPKKGTVQVTLFNPHRTVVKMFVVRYDLSDMPVNCQTFLRQRTLYMPSDALENDLDSQKWLRYLIHLRFMSSKSGRIYLHTDVRVIIFRKSDLDAATVHGQRPYELRSFTHGPLNPKFSSHKP